MNPNPTEQPHLCSMTETIPKSEFKDRLTIIADLINDGLLKEDRSEGDGVSRTAKTFRFWN